MCTGQYMHTLQVCVQKLFTSVWLLQYQPILLGLGLGLKSRLKNSILAVIFFPAYTLVQDLVISEFVTLVNSWVMLKPRRAPLWADVLILALWQGDPPNRISKLLCLSSEWLSALNHFFHIPQTFSKSRIMNFPYKYGSLDCWECL